MKESDEPFLNGSHSPGASRASACAGNATPSGLFWLLTPDSSVVSCGSNYFRSSRQFPAVHPEQHHPVAEQHGGAFHKRFEAGSEELEEVRTELV